MQVTLVSCVMLYMAVSSIHAVSTSHSLVQAILIESLHVVIDDERCNLILTINQILRRKDYSAVFGRNCDRDSDHRAFCLSSCHPSDY